jgi:hypothetical protein
MGKIVFLFGIMIWIGGGDSPYPFSYGERFSYLVDYHAGFSWPDAGKVTFSVDSGTYQGKSCFRFSGIGNSMAWYDWFYPVRDQYYSWADLKTLRPHCFQRIVNEGAHHFKQTAWFHFDEGYANIETEEKGVKTKKKVKISANATDPLAGIYQCRNIDWKSKKSGFSFVLPLLLEDSVYASTVRLEGKFNLKVNGKNVPCFKIRPSLIEGSLFKGGTEMSVYLRETDLIPIRVEAPIVVGKVVARLK